VTATEITEALSPRELEVAKLLASGDSCREIGLKLGISPKTSDTHRGRVLHKLGCRNAVDLTRLLIAAGLVELPAAAVRAA
jgi:DNA-binding CsgD family transcriptional regulator